MSIATEISRIQTNRNTIRAKLVELGMANSTDNLDRIASTIESLVNQGAVSVEIVEGTTYTIPAGYHNGSGTVKAISDLAGDAEAYKTQVKIATPTKKQQSITPDSGYYALSAVTVNAIPDAYQDVSSVTAEATDVLTGKIYVATDGSVITGTMVNNGTVSKTLDVTTLSYTIPKGFHSGSGKVQIVLETKTITPTKSAQDVLPTSGKVLQKVTVAPIPDNYIETGDATAVASDILDGKTAYVGGAKIEGTMQNNGAVSQRLSAASTSYTVPAGYHNGQGVVSISTETKTATPTKSAQTVSPSTGKVLSSVTVAAIPAAYQDVTPTTAVASGVLDGQIFVSKTGETIEGSMPNNGNTSNSIDGLSVTSVTIPSGYTSGGTVSLTDDIENALAAI